MVDETRRTILLNATFVALSYPVIAHAQRPKMYDWLPTECAPRRFPMYLIKAVLTLADGTTAYVPDQRVVANVWGETGSTHVVSPLMKPVPKRLDIRWFSFTEDRFYEGGFELPFDSMERMFAIGLAEGRSLPKPQPYDRVVVGMAPGGFVAVWMAASIETVEVATFTAREVDLPWKNVTPNTTMPRANYIASTLAEVMTPTQYDQHRLLGTPPGLYTEYHRRYRWEPKVTGNGTPISMRIVGFNGEDSFISSKGEAVPHSTRSVPTLIEFDWLPPGKTKGLKAVVTFDETEVFAAFRKLSPGDSQRKLMLNLESTSTAVSVSLQDDRYLLPLEKLQVKLYSR
jgi:hypothetical protein